MRSFVTASIIANRLCSSRDGQELLPQLVAKLIKNSVPKEAIYKFRFPQEVYLHGVDGVLVVDDTVQNLYVPSGISVWEMGTETPPRSKANKDFLGAETKLANAFPDIEPAVSPDKATVVFATSAPFQDHEKWVKEKRQNSTWKSIKVIDADTIADWLEQCPSVMLWFADVCGLPAEGIYDAEQYLRKVGVGFGVSAISPELIVAGRDEHMKHLRELVLQSNAEVHICGESVEEAAAFLAASSLKETDAYGEKPPLVFADSLANNSNNLKKCPSDLFFVWSWNCYIVYLGMGIRRLIDKRSNEKNLYQLLEDFKDDAHQLSVDNYAEYMFKKCHEERIKNCQDKTNSEKGFLRESYRKDIREEACTIFKEALGREVQFVRCCDVEEDIKKIEEGPKNPKKGIEKLVDECWAHLGKKKPSAPQLREVHEDLDLLIRIYNRYSLLTAGHKFDPHEEELFDQWDAPFRIP